jgi:hypothetical protein
VTHDQPTIMFDKPKAQRLQKAYDAAVKAGADQFTFEGNEFVTNYAKYLLEYLKNEGIL